ncbi:hypothetical protein BDZ91DRAFT_410504 [Kalaharituber pfeilii]|nr:hypothetical protein BDZ91DRAFT_410504 [Kalaharituber pfeilii]
MQGIKVFFDKKTTPYPISYPITPPSPFLITLFGDVQHAPCFPPSFLPSFHHHNPPLPQYKTKQNPIPAPPSLRTNHTPPPIHTFTSYPQTQTQVCGPRLHHKQIPASLII